MINIRLLNFEVVLMDGCFFGIWLLTDSPLARERNTAESTPILDKSLGGGGGSGEGEEGKKHKIIDA